MSTKQRLEEVVTGLPEERLRSLLDYACFLRWQDEIQDWRAFAKTQFAKGFGANEPDYSPSDLKPELNQPRFPRGLVR